MFASLARSFEVALQTGLFGNAILTANAGRRWRSLCLASTSGAADLFGSDSSSPLFSNKPLPHTLNHSFRPSPCTSDTWKFPRLFFESDRVLHGLIFSDSEYAQPETPCDSPLISQHPVRPFAEALSHSLGGSKTEIHQFARDIENALTTATRSAHAVRLRSKNRRSARVAAIAARIIVNAHGDASLQMDSGAISTELEFAALCAFLRTSSIALNSFRLRGVDLSRGNRAARLAAALVDHDKRSSPSPLAFVSFVECNLGVRTISAARSDALVSLLAPLRSLSSLRHVRFERQSFTDAHVSALLEFATATKLRTLDLTGYAFVFELRPDLSMLSHVTLKFFLSIFVLCLATPFSCRSNALSRCVLAELAKNCHFASGVQVVGGDVQSRAHA